MQTNKPAGEGPLDCAVGRPVPERDIVGELQASMTRQATGEQMTEGELWSWVRSVMCQAVDIWHDHSNRRNSCYEQYSARLDAAAAERADQLWARLKTPNVAGNRLDRQGQSG